MPKTIDEAVTFRAVIDVLAKHGYDGATTARLAESAGVSEVTIFRKYGSKLELVRRSLESLAVWDNLRRAGTYTGDLEGDLVRVVSTYRKFARQNGQLFAVLASGMGNHPELAEVIDVPYRVFSEVGSMLVRYMDAGVLLQEPPMQTVGALLGPYMVSSMLTNAKGKTYVPQPNAVDHVRRFLGGRRTDPRVT